MRSLLLLALVPVAASLVVPVHAATWHVPSECPTIQAGIDSAAFGDTVLVACDTYYEHDIVMKSGVCLTSETGSPDCVTIDAQQEGRVIYCVDVDDRASIVGLTITGGDATGAGLADSLGGGIYCETSSPTVADCELTGNTASLAGGGMCAWINSDPDLTDCTFAENSVSGYDGSGGGMVAAIGCFPSLTDCTFSDNTAFAGGGLMSYLSWPTVTRCTFSTNSAWAELGTETGGGGMKCSESWPILTDCLFVDNTSAGLSGGLHLGGCEQATITSCRFVSNTAITGGGLGANSQGDRGLARRMRSVTSGAYSRGTSSGRQSAELLDCTFALNEATFGGGMACIDETDPVLVNCTFCANAASDMGGGVYCGGVGSVRLTNCIIAFGTSGKAVQGYSEVAVYCSDIYGNAGGDWVDVITGQDLINDNFSEDPLFCFGSNEPRPLTLYETSPCAEANNPACGRVGAREVGCDTVVQASSWGTIKAMFR
jgi:hypothetical protein